MEADDPGGPDEGFKLPEPEDDDWEAWVAAGFSTWADSVKAAERRMSFHQQGQPHKSIFSKLYLKLLANPEAL